MNADAPPDRVPLLLREAAPAWTAIVALTVLAWIVTLDQVRAMGNGAGTMRMSFVAFVAMWTAMGGAERFDRRQRWWDDQSEQFRVSLD